MRITVITRGGRRMTYLGDVARLLECLREIPRLLKVQR